MATSHVSWRPAVPSLELLAPRQQPSQVRLLAPSLRTPAVGSAKQRMFVFGTGFVGRYVAERLLREEWHVAGTCTSNAKRSELDSMGMNAYLYEADKCSLNNLKDLEHATHLLISIPPIIGTGDPLLSLHEELYGLLKNGSLHWLCYLSSTGVYGDCHGQWVDEEHPVNPINESARLRYAAEEGWLAFANELGVPVVIFRLGGIYGPGRSAIDTILKGKPLSRSQMLRTSKQYTARIHVADVYQAIEASIRMPCSKKVYNVVDDDSAPRSEVFAYARDLIAERCPGLLVEFGGVAGANLCEQVGSAAEKRVSNARLKHDLGVKLLYPTYRAGLKSILDGAFA